MDDVQPEVKSAAETEAPKPEEATETPAAVAPPAEAPKVDVSKLIASGMQGGQAHQKEGRPQGRPERPPRPDNRGGDKREPRSGGPRTGERGPDRGGERRGPAPERGGGDRGGREGRPGGRPFEMAPDIELEKLIADSLYLDNQAHAVVARMRDMDSGTKSQLRRLYNAVRRAVRAPENERQHHFVMLRARLAYTIARHSLRSLDALERLLLQVTRRNDARGYERFKDLFEAIVAYNE
jgi:CRISPR type III-A-associated protein Csm2